MLSIDRKIAYNIIINRPKNNLSKRENRVAGKIRKVCVFYVKTVAER